MESTKYSKEYDELIERINKPRNELVETLLWTVLSVIMGVTFAICAFEVISR